MVIVIIAILATLLFPAAKHLQAAAEKARCMSNLRSLHVSLSSYVTDKGQWPQAPEELESDAYEAWWLHELKDFGAPPRVWQCPTISREMEKHDLAERPMLHYTPTPFDDRRFTPYRWATQPWLIEIGGLHPGGSLLIFPDGSIRSMDELYEQATGKKP